MSSQPTGAPLTPRASPPRVMREPVGGMGEDHIVQDEGDESDSDFADNPIASRNNRGSDMETEEDKSTAMNEDPVVSTTTSTTTTTTSSSSSKASAPSAASSSNSTRKPTSNSKHSTRGVDGKSSKSTSGSSKREERTRGTGGNRGGGGGSSTGGNFMMEPQVIVDKILDKDYVGKLNFDPFSEQINAEIVVKSLV